MRPLLLILALTVGSSLAHNFFKTEWKAFKEKHNKFYQTHDEESNRLENLTQQQKSLNVT